MSAPDPRTPDVRSTLIPVTTWSAKLRHLAREDTLGPDSHGGRRGKALCDSQTHADVYDQDWLDEQRARWYGKPAGSKLIADMPACKRCEKKSAALAGAVTP